jgi:hypothetical protein
MPPEKRIYSSGRGITREEPCTQELFQVLLDQILQRLLDSYERTRHLRRSNFGDAKQLNVAHAKASNLVYYDRC